jgi:nucleoside-diphosphate-sugar epimerase
MPITRNGIPTTRERLTNLDWINLAAKKLEVDAKVQPVPVWMIRMLGLFIPIMREFPEMVYQYEQDYIFDSSKFEKRFGIMATPPEEGIADLVKA